MQIVIRDRVNQSEPITAKGQPIDISGYAAFSMNLVAHMMSGTSPTIVAGFEVSDNLEDWLALTPSVTRTTAGMDTDIASIAGGDALLRYVRASITTTGTDPVVNYSLTINLFQGT